MHSVDQMKHLGTHLKSSLPIITVSSPSASQVPFSPSSKDTVNPSTSRHHFHDHPAPNHHVSHMDYCNNLEQLSLLPLPTRKTEGLINVMSFSCSKFSSRCSFHVSARMICGISGPLCRLCFPSPRPPITWASLLLRAFARTVLSAWDALPPDNWKTQFFILVGTLLKCHYVSPEAPSELVPKFCLHVSSLSVSTARR